MLKFALSLRHISIGFQEDSPLFGCDLSFSKGRTGLVGRNGTGKSTLLRVAAGEISPLSGQVVRSGSLTFCRQQNGETSDKSVSSWLGIGAMIQARIRIELGEMLPGDLELIDGKWALEADLLATMARYGLGRVSFDTPVCNLSGGELTRLRLAFAFASSPDILLMDEPSNNLDSLAHEQLYRDIRNYKGTLVVASHDRELLEMMDRICEISSLGMSEYGGSYSFYQSEKTKKTEAADAMVQARIGLLSKAKSQIQKRREIHEQGEAKGRRTKKDMIAATGRTDKLALNAAKGRSEKTNKKIRAQADRKLLHVSQQLADAKKQIEEKYKFEIALPATRLHNSKKVLEADQLCFGFSESRPLFKDFSVCVTGPERIAIEGPNGSGKSTLISLLLKKHRPWSGSCSVKVDNYAYLDQKAASLDDELTVLENFRSHNSSMLSAQVFQVLSCFLFRKDMLHQNVRTLSGGERVRLLLACILMSEQPPQLLILDEPTNHLDIDSIQCIESALDGFEGAVLAVSHDKKFLTRIGVTRRIRLDRSQ